MDLQQDPLLREGGAFPILKEARWPERFDCALLTSKGYASRATRGLIDLLGDSDAAIQVFCIHDSDAYGTRIYQAIQKATAARPGRKVEIINLGLDPEEAIAMGLDVEKVSRKGKKAATVGDYVTEPWRDWLQGNRIELNAMTTPQFLGWLERKFEPYQEKVVPPLEVIHKTIAGAVDGLLREQIIARVMIEAGVDGQVRRAVREREATILGVLPTVENDINRRPSENPEELWLDPVRRIVLSIAIERGLVRAA